MLTQERYQTILQILSDRDAVTVSELSQMMGISESTVRRDLNYLDDLGKLKKVFGGATAVNQSSGITEASFETRENTMREEKTAIAKYSATLIHDGDLVFIDAGTTTYRMIDFLTNKNAKFVTSGIAHARKLIKKGFSTYIIGGNVKPITEAVVGPESIAMLSKLNFTKAFLGTNGIDIDAGFTTTDTSTFFTAVCRNSTAIYCNSFGICSLLFTSTDTCTFFTTLCCYRAAVDGDCSIS